MQPPERCIWSFTGNVSIGGTLTYEDVVNVDSVGLITARQGIRCLMKEVHFGNTQDLQLYHNGTIIHSLTKL